MIVFSCFLPRKQKIIFLGEKLCLPDFGEVLISQELDPSGPDQLVSAVTNEPRMPMFYDFPAVPPDVSQHHWDCFESIYLEH